MLPLVGKLLASRDSFEREIVVGRQVRKQEKHRDGIIEVPQRISECRIPFLHNVVKFDLRLIILLKALGVRVVATAKCFGKLFGKGFVFAKFLKDRLMEKVLYIFCLLWSTLVLLVNEELVYRASHT